MQILFCLTLLHFLMNVNDSLLDSLNIIVITHTWKLCNTNYM